MTKTAILNTSIVTSFGEFKYSPVSLDEAREMVVGNPDGYLSAVGHEATAGIITTLLGVEVPVNRIQFAQEVGQQALVFKLRGRAPEGVILTAPEVEAIGYDLGRLTRIA